MTTIRQRLKKIKMGRPGSLSEGAEKMKLAARFFGPSPDSMDSFNEYSRLIFGQAINLKRFNRSKDGNLLEICSLEMTSEFLDNPYIKRWRHNYGIKHMELCYIFCELVFGGSITELHIQNYLVVKLDLDLVSLEESKRLSALGSDYYGPQYQKWLEKQLIKRGKIT